MSLTIRRLLLASASMLGIFTATAEPAQPAARHIPEPRGNFWSRSPRWRRMPKSYPYSGAREERRALLRLEFKLENGRWP